MYPSRRGYKPVLIVLCAALLLAAAVFATVQTRTATAAYAAAAGRYRGTSEVNARLVADAAADLAAGMAPGDLSRALDDAVTRELQALQGLQDAARSWWLPPGGRPVAMRSAECEASSLAALARTARRFVSLPTAEWSDAIPALRDGQAAFLEAHRELGEK